MILGYLSHSDKEGLFYLPLVQQGLAYLRNTDFSKMPLGKVEIDGDSLYASVSEYMPEDREKRKAETHTKYIDIQYIVSGEEVIGVSQLSAAATSASGYSAETDATFYQSVENEMDITLSQGMYLVLFPWDIHRPGCISQAGLTVRKVVLKCKVTELEEQKELREI